MFWALSVALSRAHWGALSHLPTATAPIDMMRPPVNVSGVCPNCTVAGVDLPPQTLGPLYLIAGALLRLQMLRTSLIADVTLPSEQPVFAAGAFALHAAHAAEAGEGSCGLALAQMDGWCHVRARGAWRRVWAAAQPAEQTQGRAGDPPMLPGVMLPVEASYALFLFGRSQLRCCDALNACAGAIVITTRTHTSKLVTRCILLRSGERRVGTNG